MESHQKVLFIDAATAFYRITRYVVGEPYFGPIDLGLHLAGRYRSLNKKRNGRSNIRRL